MRLWVSHVHAGTIIGKGGAYIKAVRQQSSCRVMVAEASQPGAERLVTIIGPAASVQTAVELLVEKVTEADQLLTPVAPGAPPPSQVLKLCAPNGQVGGIIGKGGAQISEFRQQSGANIKVETTAGPELMRLVTIIGGKAEVLRAHELIALKLASLPPDEPPNGVAGGPPYGGHAAKYQRTQSYAQHQAPPQQLMPGQSPNAPRGAMRPSGFGGGFYAPPPGSGNAIGQPQHAYAGGMAVGYRPEYAQMPSYGMPSDAQGYFAGTSGYSGESRGDSTSHLVPSHLAGKLIGKGGAGIRELREASHAQIKILSECEPGTDQRRITVTGTPEAMQLALSLINQKLAT